MVYAEVLLLALIHMCSGLRSAIGQKGTRIIMRDASRYAGYKLLESLIDQFPETLSKEEALARSCSILEHLGFAKSITFKENKIDVVQDTFTELLEEEDIHNSPIVYFLAGLIEGFVAFMSDQKVTLVPQDVQRGKIVYNVT